VTTIARILSFACILFLAAPALAQSGQPFGDPPPANNGGQPANTAPQAGAQQKSEPAFYAGDIDIIVGGGIGGLVYPYIEPAVDVGLIPLNEDFSISVGGGVQFGWCLLCAALDAVSDLDFSSSYIQPYGRALIHSGTLGGLLDGVAGNSFTIDLNAGLMAGPSFYSLTITEENVDNPASVDYSQTSFILGPVAGARLGFSDNTFFLFVEYRFVAEIGLSQIEYIDRNGNTIAYGDDAFSQDGSDFMLGLGFRI
jgi:hypothetical protein